MLSSLLRAGVVTSVGIFLTSCAALKTPSPLRTLGPGGKCDKCSGYLLPGRHVPSQHTVYRIDSDLPELYTSNGVLYTTRQTLPPFKTLKGEDVPLDLRKQVNHGFTTIDDSFEVFLYHLSQEQKEGETRRIVVLVENEGTEPATVIPRESIYHGPNRAQPDSIESELGIDVLTENWRTPYESVTIAPGSSAIISATKQLAAGSDGPDTSASPFVTGIIRADVMPAGLSDLVVSVVSIPGNIPEDEYILSARTYLDKGANSSEQWIDLTTAPSGCEVRRVVGTAKNVMWESDPMVIDVSKMPVDDLYFMMAKFAVQSEQCMEARQSTDLLLHPGYVHPDSVGNYMMEYYVTLNLVNRGVISKNIDIQYGKMDAPIGLGWQMIIGEEKASLEELEPLDVEIGWAGMKRAENEPYYKETMLSDGPIEIKPGQEKWVSMRMMVLGTSSLPYQLHVVDLDQQ